MSKRALVLAIAACFAAAACDTKKDEPPKPKITAQAVVTVPSDAPKAQQVADAPKSGTAAPGKGRPGCGQGKCMVRIALDDKCVATYNAEHLSVYGPNNTITWHLTGGWKFTPNGIDLPAGGGQFTNPRGGGTATFSWDDKNTDKNQYKYTINAEKSGKTCKVDPSVVNGADFADPNYPPP